MPIRQLSLAAAALAALATGFLRQLLLLQQGATATAAELEASELEGTCLLDQAVLPLEPFLMPKFEDFPSLGCCFTIAFCS